MYELALPVAQALYGGFQAIKAHNELNKLRKEDLSYQATPQTRNILGVAGANAQHGYTEAEKAAFLQQVASNTAKAYRLGMSRAGNSMSNAIGASNQIANGQAFNQFAAQDANQQRQNQGIYNNLVGQDQSRANMNTQYAMHNNQMAQHAFGQAQQQGVNNIFGALQMGSMIAGQGGGAAGGFGNKGAMNFANGAVQGVANVQQPQYQNQVPQFNPAYPMYGKPTFNQYMQQNVNPYNAPYYQVEAPYNNMWSPYFNQH